MSFSTATTIINNSAPPGSIPLECFTSVSDKASLIEYFNENIAAVNNGYFEVKFTIVSSVTIFVAVIFVLRHMVTTESRSIHIRNFLRSKGVDNDNTSNVVLQPSSTIAYNLAMWVLRLTLFLMAFLPSVPAPSPFPKDFFAPLVESSLTAGSALFGNDLPPQCVFRPGWFGTTYACMGQRCNPLDIDSGAAAGHRHGGTFAPGSTYSQGRELACKTCGDQFELPLWFLEQQTGYVPAENCSSSNSTSNNNNTNNNNNTCVTLPPPPASSFNGSVGTLFYTTMHEDPIFGAFFIIGVCSAVMQVLLEWYFNKRLPNARRKLRAVSVTLLNFYDFMEQLQDPKVVFYKEYDWKFLIGGFLVQGVAFFTPMIFLFATYPKVCMISFWPVLVLCVMSCWDILWLLFVLVERKSDYEDLKWTDFDPQFQLLKVSKVGHDADMIGVVDVSASTENNAETKSKTNLILSQQEGNSENKSKNDNVDDDDNNKQAEESQSEKKEPVHESLENEIKKIEEEEETRLSRVRFPVEEDAKSKNESQLTVENSGNSQTTSSTAKDKISKLKNTFNTILDVVSLPTEAKKNNDGEGSDNNGEAAIQARKLLEDTKILRLPTTLDELLPATKPRTKNQCYEVMAWIASTLFVPMALIKFIPGPAITPSITVLVAVPFVVVALFWRTRNSFRLAANDDGTLTFYLVKAASSGISIFIDITHGLLHGNCKIEFIYNEEYYEKNKIDKNEWLMANFFVDHLKYELYLHPGSESKIRQQLEWLEIVVKNSHRDLYTSEKTTEVPRKQTADTRLSHLLSFLGRAIQSEDILLLALRLDPNSQIAQTSLHAMTVQKVDPGSLSFDRRRGDQTRLSFRMLAWLWALTCTIIGLLLPDPLGNGIIGIERQPSGGGSYYCASSVVEVNGKFYDEGSKQVAHNANQVDVRRFPLYLFPQIIYVEIFVYTLLLAVHLDMIYRKRCVLESPLLIRLQAAGGILAALHWPTGVGFLVTSNMGNEFDLTSQLFSIAVWNSCRLLNSLICPALALIFPLVS